MFSVYGNVVVRNDGVAFSAGANENVVRIGVRFRNIAER